MVTQDAAKSNAIKLGQLLQFRCHSAFSYICILKIFENADCMTLGSNNIADIIKYSWISSYEVSKL